MLRLKTHCDTTIRQMIQSARGKRCNFLNNFATLAVQGNPMLLWK
jgi:hypothetical protein